MTHKELQMSSKRFLDGFLDVKGLVSQTFDIFNSSIYHFFAHVDGNSKRCDHWSSQSPSISHIGQNHLV